MYRVFFNYVMIVGCFFVLFGLASCGDDDNDKSPANVETNEEKGENALYSFTGETIY